MFYLPLIVIFVRLTLIVSSFEANSSDDNITISYNETDNITFIEVNNATDVNNVTTNLTDTTESPISTPTVIPTIAPGKKSCPCDVTETCDDNCCCDPDCVIDGMHIVESCRSSSATILDQRYCSNSKPKYDLFCVVYDNLQQRHLYQQPDKIKVNLKNAIPNNPFSWTNDIPMLPAKKHVETGPDRLTARGTIYVTRNNEEPVEFSLPFSLYNDFCDTEEPIRYLVDASVCCSVNPQSSPCVKNSVFDLNRYANLTFLTPFNDNVTNDTTCDFGSNINASCISVSLPQFYDYLERDGSLSRRGIKNAQSLPELTFDPIERVCRNAVLSIAYRIIHYGRKGITSVRLDFELGSFTTTKPVMQSFKASFKYHKETVNRKENPGYKLGQPIVIGKNASLNESVKNIISSVSDFRIISQSHVGFCLHQNASKMFLKFGINSNIGCVLKLPTGMEDNLESRCQKMGEITKDYLFNVENAHNVATFAKSDQDNINEWVYLKKEGFWQNSNLIDGRMCPIVTSLHIDIWYAMTGLVINPQAKVLAATVNAVDEPFLLCSVNCPDYVEINLKTTVSYKDLTSRPGYIFGQPPKIRTSLPKDFLYPFLSNAQSSSYTYEYILVILNLSLVFLNLSTM